jgi:hypothetical protein
METEVWEALGKPSDLNPSTDANDTIKKWVCRGYKKILFWKLPNGRLLRFRCTEGELFFKTVVKTGTASDGSSTTITLESGAVGANDDQYNGWIVKITGGTGSGQSRLITDYSGTSLVATVSEDWTTAPDSTSTYSLFKRFMKFLESGDVGADENIILSPTNSLYSVSKITDLEDLEDLTPAERTENWTSNLTEDSIPGEYLVYGDRIVFDTAYSTTRWFRMEYIKIPPDLSNDSDIPAIPEPWHEAIVLWATWKGLKRSQEGSEAYSVKRDLYDLIEMTATQGELSQERENAGVRIDFG